MSLTSASFEPAYRHLQQTDPLHWHEDGCWVLTGYQDVKSVLLDPRFGHADYMPPGTSPQRSWLDRARGWLTRGGRELPRPDPDHFAYLRSKWIAVSNPPLHAHLRTMVGQALTLQRMNAMRPRIHDMANQLIDQVEERRTMDLVSEFAYPLSTLTICDLLGVPPADYPALLEHLEQGQRAFTQLGTTDPEAIRQVHAHASALTEYFRTLIAARQRAPQDDLISALTLVADEERRLSDDELLGNVVLLAIAGHETTYQLLTTCVWLLLQQPDALQAARAEAGMSKAVLQELLRLCGPTQITARVALEDVPWKDKTIRKGQMVRLALAAANRDEQQFAAADVFDPTRRQTTHLTFGAGIHQCPGAPLARLEMTIALEILLRRLPGLKLQTTAVEWRSDIFLSPRELRIVW